MRNFYLVLLVLAFAGCKKEFQFNELDNLNYEPSFAVPLVDSRFEVSELLDLGDNGTIKVIDPTTGLLAVCFEQTIFDKSSADLIDLEADPIQNSMTLNSTQVSELINSGSTFASDDFSDAVFNTPVMDMQEVVFQGGNLKLNIDYDWQFDATITYVFNHIRKANGDTLRVVQNFFYNGSSINFEENLDLNGMTLTLYNGGNLNMMDHSVRVAATNNGGNPNIVDAVNYTVTFENAEHASIAGDVLVSEFESLSQNLTIDALTKISAGDIRIKNPNLSFSTNQSFAINMNLLLDSLYTINQNTGERTVIGGFTPVNPIAHPAYPSDVNIASEFIVDTLNSNLEDLFDDAANEVVFVGGISIEDNNVGLDAIYDDSRLTIDLNVEAPLEIGADVVLLDTVPSALSIDSIEQVEGAALRTYTLSAIPFDGALQFYFIDSTGTVVDSIFEGSGQLFKSATFDNNGEITPGAQILDVAIDNQKLAKLEQANRMVIKASITTAGFDAGEFIQLRNSQYLEVKAGIVVDLNVKL